MTTKLSSTVHNLFMRQVSLVSEPGMEGQVITRNCFEGHNIGVLTSGGDSQGMNSAVRAVVRMGIYCGSKVYLIKEGYQGLVDGGEKNIVEATWASVSGIMNLGGTVIGSARCSEFRERSGRLQAAYNLIQHEINNLVVIGGDGSLTGANIFKNEWSSLLAELVQMGRITDPSTELSQLNLVGLVGSIDNDFCGTDITIGTDSALHRIIEACDAITSTALSHQRCFILEVMGRNCGYLALVAALATEAEWVFIPEYPPQVSDWMEKLGARLTANKIAGQRVNTIIVAEGARDMDGAVISAKSLQETISDNLKIDCRITVLGHVQRGGSPSAFDRILGIRMGAEAVLALISSATRAQRGGAEGSASFKDDACVIAIVSNQIVRVPLMKCVEKTKEVTKAMENGQFDKAVKLRGKSFLSNLNTYIKLSKSQPPKNIVKTSKNIAIINVGAPACGMNAAMRSFTRLLISHGYSIWGINEGFEGLAQGKFTKLNWNSVRHWSSIGGSNLGIRRDTPQSVGFDRVHQQFQKMNLSGLLLIGGFEAFSSLLQLYKSHDRFSSFCIPMLVLPATISNNVPGTDFSLGADSSINEITHIIDKVKQSALGTKRRVFVVETQGGYCGYLATMSGLAGGADAAYIFEEPFTIDDLRCDVKHMIAKIEDNVQHGLILVNEKSNPNYNSDFILRIFSEEGLGLFDARINIPGHLQQGGAPSPFDRNLGTKLGYKASQWFMQQLSEIKEYDDKESACLLGILCSEFRYTPVIDLEGITDFKHRIPYEEWWMNLRSLLRIMAKHESLYASDIALSNIRKKSFIV